MALRLAAFALLVLALAGPCRATSPAVAAVAPQDADAPCSYADDPVGPNGELVNPAELAAAEERFDASPDDGNARRALVDATFAFAEDVLYSSCAPERERLELARRLLSQVLELDGENR